MVSSSFFISLTFRLFGYSLMLDSLYHIVNNLSSVFDLFRLLHKVFCPKQIDKKTI